MAQVTPPTEIPKPSWFNISAAKNSLKKYGTTGLMVYLGISFSVTAGWYVAIERHVDVKTMLGLNSDKAKHCNAHQCSTYDPNKEPSWFQSLLIGKGSNLALAIICSKVCVPLKIPVALAVTPYVHRWREEVFKSWAFGKFK